MRIDVHVHHQLDTQQLTRLEGFIMSIYDDLKATVDRVSASAVAELGRIADALAAGEHANDPAVMDAIARLTAVADSLDAELPAAPPAP